MKLARRRFLHLAACAATIPAVSRTAWAQSYPSRPIRLVIPYPPGGVQDAIGRPWADRMTSLLGTVFVENIGGGGGELAASTVSRARPDGYTILLGNSSVMVINPIAGSQLSYDPIGSFDAVSILGHITQAIAVNPSLPVRTLKELADYAKRNPGKLSYDRPALAA
jgi:tripartite-type tricarboxylate transporter receptor subunit TctC